MIKVTLHRQEIISCNMRSGHFFVEFLPQEVWKMAFLYVVGIIPKRLSLKSGIISTYLSFLGWVFLFMDCTSWPSGVPKTS